MKQSKAKIGHQSKSVQTICSKSETNTQLGELCIDYSLKVNNLDLLFGEDSVFRRFEKQGMHPLFLTLLEPFILSDRLQFLPQNVLSSLVQDYIQKNQQNTLENVLLHLDISKFPFKELTELCATQSLTRALLYAYTSVKGDYITPFEEILKNLTLYSSGSAGNEDVS